MPAKTKSSSPDNSEPTKPAAKKAAAKAVPAEALPSDTPPAETVVAPKKEALDLLEEKPKKKREPSTATNGLNMAKIGQKAKAPAPASKTPEPTTAAPAAPEEAAPVEEKKEALSLFDEKERKKKRREESPPVVNPNRSSILTPISRRIADKEAKAKQEAEELATLFQRSMDVAPATPEAAPTETPATTEASPTTEATSEPVAPTPVAVEEVPESVEPDDPDSKIIHLKPPIIVKELAEKLGVKGFKLIAELLDMDIFVSVTQHIEPEVAAKLCENHGFHFERDRREKGAGIHKEEKIVAPPPPPVEEKKEAMQPRPPIITIMGHVDHGKTSLLDAIRKTKVVAGEAGGITQHVGAYSVEHKGQKITFLDTPGHAAFTAMRARGASLTDIVILVVAADDGLMPQTLESISHAKAAGVVIVVAMNKIDLASANPDRIYAQLSEQGLNPEEWGGSTAVMKVSAKNGTGIEALLEHTLLEAELLELKANPSAPCRAIIVESRVEAGKGPCATLIARTGTLKAGDSFICGPFYGKVKGMSSDTGKPVKLAGPATPVEVTGFSDLPNVGDELVVMNDREAKRLSEQRVQEQRIEKLAAPRRTTLENIFKQMAEGEKKELKVILKSDVQGSLEAIVGQLRDIKSKKIDLNILHAAVGPISESDILLASASDAIVLGFATKVEGKAVKVAKSEGVHIKLFSIIYELFDQVKEAMLGMLDPETRQKVAGHAVVKQIFKIQRGRAAGCTVTDGRLFRTGYARVLRGREKVPVYDGKFHTLRRHADEVPEVRNGLDCGVRLGDFDEYEEGDIIECYELEKLAQTL